MRALAFAMVPIATWADETPLPALPSLDPTPLCDDAERRGEVFSADLCLRSEAVARDVLAKSWSSLSPDLLAACVAAGEATGSYGVLMTCVVNGPLPSASRDPADQQD